MPTTKSVPAEVALKRAQAMNDYRDAQKALIARIERLREARLARDAASQKATKSPKRKGTANAKEWQTNC